MQRTLNAETNKYIGKKVKVSGWVNSRRDHGKIIFIDLRDISGILQIVFTPKDSKIYKKAQELRPEWVISLEGIVQERPKQMVNPKLLTGKVELQVEKLE